MKKILSAISLLTVAGFTLTSCANEEEYNNCTKKLLSDIRQVGVLKRPSRDIRDAYDQIKRIAQKDDADLILLDRADYKKIMDINRYNFDVLEKKYIVASEGLKACESYFDDESSVNKAMSDKLTEMTEELRKQAIILNYTKDYLGRLR